MEDVVHEYVALYTEIIRAVRASVPTQQADPIRPGVHGGSAGSIGRVLVRIPIRRGSPSPSSGECGGLEHPRTPMACRTRISGLFRRHAVTQSPAE